MCVLHRHRSDISGAVVFLASGDSARITDIETPGDSGHLVLHVQPGPARVSV